MLRCELLSHLYDLATAEEERFLTGQTVPSRFYEELDRLGMRDERGVYHLPSTFFQLPAGRPDGTIWGKLERSRHQSLLLLKKASRFYQEPPAYADFISIRYVYSGQTHIRTFETDFYLRANDLCLLSNGFVFSQFLHNREDLVFTIMFEKEYLLKSVLDDVSGGLIARFITNYICGNKNPQNYIIFHGGDNDRIRHLMEDMLCEYIDPSPYGGEMIESYIKLLLFEMLGCGYEFLQTPESRHSYQLAAILSRIATDYRTLTLEELADSLGYNRSYLSRMIKEGTGMNFKDLILEKRMEHAAVLLKNSSLPIHEIIPRCGLANESYFYIKFREFYGCSPKEFKSRQG